MKVPSSPPNTKRVSPPITTLPNILPFGGDRDKEALDRQKFAIGRVESPRRSASAEESNDNGL